jgi:hypothetical protein
MAAGTSVKSYSGTIGKKGARVVGGGRIEVRDSIAQVRRIESRCFSEGTLPLGLACVETLLCKEAGWSGTIRKEKRVQKGRQCSCCTWVARSHPTV